MFEVNMNSLNWLELNLEVDIPKLDSDVDLDELDFEGLPCLTNFCEVEIKEDPDGDAATSRINSNETNNNGSQNRDESWIESNQSKKQFQCDICLKNFSKKAYLKVHRRVHTGEKPYACEFCEKRFSHRVSLKHHKMIHTGEKPYQCELCNESFRRRQQLVLHQRRHSGEKPQ